MAGALVGTGGGELGAIGCDDSGSGTDGGDDPLQVGKSAGGDEGGSGLLLVARGKSRFIVKKGGWG